MQTESKQQILERRKEIDLIRKRPHTIGFDELRGKSASNGAEQELVEMLK